MPSLAKSAIRQKCTYDHTWPVVCGRVAARVVICLEALLLVVLLYVAETAFDLGGCVGAIAHGTLLIAS